MQPESAIAAAERGKLSLVEGDGPGALCFNLSHSGDLGLYAVAAVRVGVDAERVRDGVDVRRIAGRLFAPSEQAALEELPESERRRAFFAAWTRKEACAKALGEGLTHPAASFTVPLSLAENAERLAGPEGGPDLSGWSLWNLEPKPGYAAALAAEGADLELRCFDLTEGERRLLRGCFPRPADD